MKVTTAVTCPTMRIHPAIIAQAAATSAVLLDGRFCLGVGSGEALNEHILGDRWPEADERLEMLEEAVEVIRTAVGGRGPRPPRPPLPGRARRVYDLPDRPPPIVVSGFGPKAIELAARIGDGYCTVGPDAESVEQLPVQGGERQARAGRAEGVLGRGRGAGAQDRPPPVAQRGAARRARAGPAHARALRAGERARDRGDGRRRGSPCGPDVDRHVAAIKAYADAGFDELYINQIGPEQDAFFAAYRDEVLPRVR